MEEKIEAVGDEIRLLEGKIEALEKKVEAVEAALSGGALYLGITDRGVLFKEKDQLLKKEEQLREKERQLREKERMLLKKEQLREIEGMLLKEKEQLWEKERMLLKKEQLQEEKASAKMPRKRHHRPQARHTFQDTDETQTQIITTMAQRARPTRSHEMSAKYQDGGEGGAAAGLGSFARIKTTMPRLPGITGNNSLASRRTAAAERALALTDVPRNRQPYKQGSAAMLASHIAGSSINGGEVVIRDGDADDAVSFEELMGDLGESGKMSVGGGIGSSSDAEEEDWEDESDDGGADGDIGISQEGDEVDVGGAAGSPGVPCGAAPTAKVSDALRQSVRRNSGRPYSQTPVVLLRAMCAMRKVQGYSKEKSSTKLDKVLTIADLANNRPTPYWADMEDKVAGGTPAASPPAPGDKAGNPPAVLVTGVRAAIANGLSVSKTKMYDYDGSSYTAEAILAVIDAENAARATEIPTTGRRKSKHCVPRWVELLVDERFRAGIAASKTSLRRDELDRKQTGKTRRINLQVWDAWKDKTVKVAQHFPDDEHIVGAGIDPNIVHQPDCTFDKFTDMGRAVIKHYNTCKKNHKASGSHDDWFEFC